MLVKIKKLDNFGRGITYIDGKICFVQDALENEEVDIFIIKETSKYILAKVNKINVSNKDRVKSDCIFYNECGGCNLMHLNYLKENIFKKNKVEELLNKYSNINTKVLDIVSSKEVNYRNKVVFHVKNKKIGLYSDKTNDIVEIDNCLLLNDKINNLIPIFKKIVLNNDINSILVRVSNDSKFVMVKIDGIIREKFNYSFCDSLYINDKLVYGNNNIISTIGNFKYYVSPDSFFQVNTFLTKNLYDEVRNNIISDNYDNVLDLYCGTGTIGIYVSDLVNKVVGVDYNKSNILDAIKNKELNNVNNIEFINDKVENVIDRFTNIDLVIVDPPRKGLDKYSISNLKKIKARTIIYVSCDPITLVRDLNLLSDTYDVNYIKPFNMFPKTYHVECVSVLNRKIIEK